MYYCNLLRSRNPVDLHIAFEFANYYSFGFYVLSYLHMQHTACVVMVLQVPAATPPLSLHSPRTTHVPAS